MEKHRKRCHHDWDGSGWDSSSDWDGHDFDKKKKKCCHDDWDSDFDWKKKKCVDHRRIDKFDHHRFKFGFCCRKPWREVIHCTCGKCIPVEKKRCCKDW